MATSFPVSGAHKASDATSVRWVVLTLLFFISFVSYLERSNISVLAVQMMPALSLTTVQIGKINSLFLLGYAIFQIPGGMLGDKYGSRIVLGIAALSWGVISVLTAFVPGIVVRGAGVFAALVVIRFLLGIGEAATYPVCTLAVRNWLPLSHRAFANAMMFAGLSAAVSIGNFVFPWLMSLQGWRACFYISSVPAFLIGILWMWYSTDAPEKHPRVNAAEVALIEEGGLPEVHTANPFQSLGRVLKDKNLVLLVISYFSEGYVLFIFVFWLFYYLTQIRKFGNLSGGFWASLPWLLCVASMPLGGYVSDRIAARKGGLAGAKFVIMVSYTLAGASLFWAAASQNSIVAVLVLACSVAFLGCAESSFWASAAYLAKDSVGSTGGLMNTVGVLGGVVSTWLVPVLADHFGWLVALGSGAVVAVFCPIVWLAIPTHPIPVVHQAANL